MACRALLTATFQGDDGEILLEMRRYDIWDHVILGIFVIYFKKVIFEYY